MILGILGVPVWLLVGVLVAGLISRKRVATAPGVFRCKLRQVDGDLAGFKPTWPRRPSYGRWVHDVLLVHKGLAVIRTLPVPVASMNGSVRRPTSSTLTHLGNHPLSITLVVDDGAVAELGFSADSQTLAMGPFAAVSSTTAKSPSRDHGDQPTAGA